jgi:N-acetylmuramoyl-L-alanine amidase
MRKIDLIIIHCAATPADMDVGAKEIRDWHVKGNGWDDIGYHFVIRRNGTVETGRPLEKIGAHAKGYNKTSIGICLVGGARRDGKKLVAEENFTPAQWKALKRHVRLLLERFPGCRLIGHRDVEPGKECPTFSVREWAKYEQIAQAPSPV